MNTTINSLLQLNQLESFNFAFKYLWSPDINRRAKLHIVDTIIFKDGLPYYWIFSSDKTGEILKKKTERLKSIPEILKYLKSRNRTLKGYKNSMLKSKVATVWYAEANQRLSCSIVDEVELQALTNTKMSDIICIQSYMSGFPLKGNGIFEHRMWTQKDGGVKHLTYEGATEISLDTQQKCNLYTSQTSGKLIITENHHNILSSLCNYLIRHFALTANLKVTDLTFQVIFSASHTPYIVYFRKISISDASSSYLDENQRINLIYPTGELPFGLDVCVEVSPCNDVALIQSTVQKQQQQDVNKYPNYAAEVAKKPLERLTKQESLAKQEVDFNLINEIIATKPPPTTNSNNHVVRRPLSSSNTRNHDFNKVSTIKSSNNPPREANSDIKLRLEMESLIPNFGQKPVTYYSKSDLFGIPQDYTKSNLSATLHPYQAQLATKVMDNNHMNAHRKGERLFDESRNHNNKQQQRESYDQVYRPLSASSVNMLRQTIMQSAIQYNGGFSPPKHATKSSSDNSPKRRQQVDLADINQEFIVKPYETITEASKFASTFYKRLKDIADGNFKHKENIFANRRPISAPHPTDSSKAKYLNLLDDEDNQRDLNSEESGSVNKKLNNTKGFSVRKILSLSGTSCFGTYCNFDQRAKSAAMGEAKAQVSLNKSEKCQVCPHRIAYKSLLLAKAETKFLGTDMDENIESFVDQMKLNSSSVELLYTYFIKKHLNRIAQQCLAEAEKVMGNNSDIALKEDLNSIYRRLIYHDALQQVHPSRFYFTVPICQMCYNIYTFMDAQREKIVLLTTEKHQADAKKMNFIPKHHDKIRPLSAPSAVSTSGRLMNVTKTKSTANDFEDIFIEDSTANNDFFIPQHTAQRDVEKDNKLNQTAHVRQLAAKFYSEKPKVTEKNYEQQENLVVAPVEILSQPRMTVVNGHSRVTLRPGQLSKHFHNRKKGVAIPIKVRVPVNSLNGGLYDETCYGNYGIGSRGPHHLDLAASLPSNPNAKAISGWVKLIANKNKEEASDSLDHPNADYIRNYGLRTQAEWDHQGAPPYIRPTSSSSLRNKINPATTTITTAKPNRPHNAQSFIRKNHISTLSVSNQRNVIVNNNSNIELERCKSQVKFAISDCGESKSTANNNNSQLVNEIGYDVKFNRPQSAGAVLPPRKANKQADHKTRFDSLYDTILYDKARDYITDGTNQPKSLISYDSSVVENNVERNISEEEETMLLSQKLSNINEQILSFSSNAAYAYSFLPFTDAPQFSTEGQIIQPMLHHNTSIPSNLPPPITMTTNSSQISYTPHSSIDSRIPYKTSQEIQNYHQRYHSQYKNNLHEDTSEVINNHSTSNKVNEISTSVAPPSSSNSIVRGSIDELPISPVVYRNHDYQALATLNKTTNTTTSANIANQMELYNDNGDNLFEKDDYFDLLDDDDELLRSNGLLDNSSIIPMNLSQNLEDHNIHISSYKQLPEENSNQVTISTNNNNNTLSELDVPSLYILQDSPSSITPMNLSQLSLSPFPQFHHIIPSPPTTTSTLN